MDYMTHLEEKIWNCLRHLDNRDFQSARAEAPELGPLDEHVSANGSALEPVDFAEINENAAIARECQLLLLAAFLDIEDRDVDALCSQLMHIFRHASRFTHNSPSQFDRLCRAVMASADDDFWCFEIVVRAATYYEQAEDITSARRWLEKLPEGDAGVFETYIERLRGVVEPGQ